MSGYDHAAIEKKWQQWWAEKELYRTPDAVAGRENFMLLTEFPYPSGNLHMGHWYSYAVPDMQARYLRMRGYNVLYPVGFDAFGLPAENAAIKRNINPKDWTDQNITVMTEQMQSMGVSFDWSRRVATTDPDYYRWTQWMFNRFLEKDLAYRAKTTVNWCPTDRTVLANEQVIDGTCERDGSPVEQKQIEQWMLRTTAYAQELVDALNDVDFPESTIAAQKNWIGPSKGARITFSLDVPEQPPLEVFTTRPDTLFGCTFVVISPELANKWIDNGWQAPAEVLQYVKQSLSRREIERMENDKSGVDTKLLAVNPLNDKKVPVWVADYVLGSYGTGAIMAVPAHDERDFEFAMQYGLLVREVIKPTQEQASSEGAYSGEGVLVNSGEYDGMGSATARAKIIEDLAARGLAEERTTYRLRDWVLSRQRYWGCPIPVIKCTECGYVPVPDDQLPVVLPPLEDFKPSDDGRSPLAKASEWVKVSCPKCEGPAERETDTMDTFVDSSWYFLRYTDPTNQEKFADTKKIKAWLPVPMYVGGAEHNTMHLLYSRFWTRALKELGHLDFAEPYLGRRNHGVILGPDGQKMSKSRGNVVDPDNLVKQYGADTIRLYMAFMAPYEQGGPWNPKGINGSHRFLKRLWDYVQEHAASDDEGTEASARAVHSGIKEIGEDIAGGRYNTAVSWAMKMLNALESESRISKKSLKDVVTIIAPLAPHITEELWQGALGQKDSVHQQQWPAYDSAILEQDVVEIAVQVNGKLRGTVMAGKDETDEQLLERAHGSEQIKRHFEGRNIKKVVYIKGRILNVVTD